jgi:uncharacterized protein (DUF169 family)
MNSVPRDYSILDKLNFERKPVGVKFLMTKPEGIERISKALNFCEMLNEAQQGNSFYAGKEDFYCVEPMLLGMVDPEPVLVGGMVGETDMLFREARANRKLYQYLPKMIKGSVRYVVFSPSDRLTFDPDVMVITTDVRQAQVILRAITYSTGDAWTSKGTPVATCAWMYIYPVLSGEMNITITGLGMGMQAVKALPEGLILISVPWNLLPAMLENLEVMSWEPQEAEGGDVHRARFIKLLEDLRKQITSP